MYILKIISIVIAAIFTALGEFLDYKSKGKLTNWGKLAIILLLISIPVAITSEIIDRNEKVEDEKLQNKRYNSNIDSLSKIYSGLQNEVKINQIKSVADAKRHEQSMLYLNDIISKSILMVSNMKDQNMIMKEQNIISNSFYSKTIDSLTLISKNLLKTSSTINSTYESINILSFPAKLTSLNLKLKFKPKFEFVQTAFKTDFDSYREFNPTYKRFPPPIIWGRDKIDSMRKKYEFSYVSPTSPFVFLAFVYVGITNSEKDENLKQVLYSGTNFDYAQIVLIDSVVEEQIICKNVFSISASNSISSLKDFIGCQMNITLMYWTERNDDIENIPEIEYFNLKFGENPSYRLALSHSDMKIFSSGESTKGKIYDGLETVVDGVHTIILHYSIPFDDDLFNRLELVK